MLCQLVLPRPRHVVSEINPFLLGPGSAVDFLVTAGVEATPNLLDFFPIWPKFAASEELCTRDKNERNAENRWCEPSMKELYQSMNNEGLK